MAANSTGSFTKFGFVEDSQNSSASVVFPVTTKGDTMVCSGTAGQVVRLAAGIDGQFLTADSTTGTGLKYTDTLVTPKITSLSSQTYGAGYLPIGVKFDTGLVAIITDVTTNGQTQTLTNKTLNSASNTIQVNGTNINSIINQPLLTSSAVQFGGVTTPSVTVYNGPTTIYSAITSLATVPRSVALPNADGNVILDTATQTLTNKTIVASSNTITVGGTNITSLINQDVRTTATPAFVGVTLATTGGTPFTLNFCEYLQQATTMSGPWAAAQNLTLTIERLGNRVTIGWNASFATTNSSTFITVAYTLPARFRPTNQYNCSIAVVAGGFIANGLLEVSTAGVVRYYASISGGNFPSGSSNGTANTSATYFITQ